MKDSTHNVIVVIVILLIIGSVIALATIAVISDTKKYDAVCMQIGEANDLDFLFQSRGECGWGVDCNYQCRFVNSNGDQITKNVK